MKRILLATTFLICLGLTASAQSTTGTVSGYVRDAQKAAVPNATVTLVNTATNATRTTISNGEGSYTFAAIQPGKYIVKSSATNFAEGTVNIEVVVAKETDVDIVLGVQGQQLNVDVVGESGVAVQTDSPQLGTTVSGRQVLELPSVTRNPYDYIALSAGATSSNDGRGQGFAVNGQRSASGNYILDGGENNDTFVTGVAQAVPLDAVQEFTLQTSNFSAEYGRGAGFIANVSTKSGANQFHGSAYEFNRNSRLAANTFTNKATVDLATGQATRRSVFNRNQFGGTIGGPILKDKLFFFGSVEPILVRSVATRFFFVPTSELLAISSPGTKAIFQRFPLPSSGYTGVVQRRTVTPFGGGTPVNIPIFREVGRSGPRDVGAGAPQNTFLSVARLDYNFSSLTQVYGRYAFQRNDQAGKFSALNNPFTPALDEPSFQKNQNLLINLTHTFSPNLITESRVVYNRIFGPINPTTPNPAFPGFGFRFENATLPQGNSSFGGPQNLYQVFQTANLTKGNHSVKFGGQYVHLRDNRSFGAYESAEALFNDAQGFVNGVLNRFTIALNPQGRFPGDTVNAPFGPPSFTRHFHYNEFGFFIQDTYKATPRLTVTPGLRYEYFGVLHSVKDEKPLDANFYLGTGNSFAQQIANGRFLRTIDAPGNLKGHFYRPDYKNFGPRIGAAYDIFGDGKTVIRGGFGVFYDRNFGNVVFNAIQNPPNYATTRLANLTLTPDIVNNQYAAFGTRPTTTIRASSARYLGNDLKTAYTMAYNVTLEREIFNKLVAGASYVGNKGRRLYSLNNINRINSSQLLNPACLRDDSCTRLNTTATSINERGNRNRSSYDALQLKLDSRYIERLGLQFGMNYTWSHSIDDGSSFFGDDLVNGFLGFGATDPFNFRTADKGDADFDVRHRFLANFIYNVPLFKNATGLKRTLLYGYGISGILSYQTGQPFTVFDGNNPEETVENTRPILVGRVPGYTLVADKQQANVFLLLPLNTGAFAGGSTVNRVEAGTLPRNTFRRPGTRSENIALLKDFGLPTVFGREGVKVQLRGELYNVFNHPNLVVNAGSNEINTPSFFPTATGDPVEGVTASKLGNRQVVVAVKISF